MAKKPETVFRERIRPYLEKLPHTVVIPIQQKTIRGVPDFLLCSRGYFIALELKKDAKSKPDKLQEWWLNRIEDAGGVSIVVCPENWSQIYEALQIYATGQTKTLPEPGASHH
jgi:hypothetical protein